MARAGRRPGPTKTPDLILDAARALFAERGFQGTSVRAVAECAGVNAALVHHYFGTKDELYVAALRLPIDPAKAVITLLAAGPREEFAQRFVRFFVHAWRDPVTGPSLQAVLRSAVATEQGARSVRELAEDVMITRMSDALSVSPLRIAVAMSHLIGLVLGATIVGVAPLAAASDDELVDLVAPTIAAYLDPAQ